MFPSSLAVILAGLLTVLTALGAFAWAWCHRQFDDPAAQCLAMFDEPDLRLERPWESPEQRRERALAYGPLLPAPPGEWGGT